MSRLNDPSDQLFFNYFLKRNTSPDGKTYSEFLSVVNPRLARSSRVQCKLNFPVILTRTTTLSVVDSTHTKLLIFSISIIRDSKLVENLSQPFNTNYTILDNPKSTLFSLFDQLSFDCCLQVGQQWVFDVVSDRPLTYTLYQTFSSGKGLGVSEIF